MPSTARPEFVWLTDNWQPVDIIGGHVPHWCGCGAETRWEFRKYDPLPCWMARCFAHRRTPVQHAAHLLHEALHVSTMAG